MQMDKNLELVMGITASDLFNEHRSYFNGFQHCTDVGLSLVNQIKQKASFRYRGNCETDTQYKQVIPYCILKRGKEVFVYTRSGGAEDRLNGRSSIGIGGHINPVRTCDIEQNILQSMEREIDEEVIIPSRLLTNRGSFLGYINNDDDPVNQVHFGLAYIFYLDNEVTVETREKELKHGQFVKIKDLKGYSGNWEKWSQVLIDRIEDWAI
jgi:predicted NUDIX family phosphoesterase